jgi:hypothetical protein
VFAPAHALTLYFVVLLYGNSAAQAEHAAGEPHYLLNIFFIIVYTFFGNALRGEDRNRSITWCFTTSSSTASSDFFFQKLLNVKIEIEASLRELRFICIFIKIRIAA